MKIFLSHSSSIDYKSQLYGPIKNYFKGSEFAFFFPEEQKINTKDIIKNIDIFFCELTTPSIGVAIETGWADAFDKPIFCFIKKGATLPSAFKYLTNKIYTYSTTKELLELMQKILITCNSINKI